MGKYGKQSVAGLMVEFNSQKRWYVSRCCGRKFAEKSDAYVSTEIEIINTQGSIALII
jgi:hypothetical protein